MLDCRQDTIVLVLLTRASPHMLDIIWVKQGFLRLIRPPDMVPVIHALGQVVFSKLFAGFILSQLQDWPCKPTCCSVWRMVWQHSCVCFLKPASAPDAQHKDSTSLIDPCEACSELNLSWKTSVLPWPLYFNSVPGCYWTSYSLGHLCGEKKIIILKSSESSLPWGAMLNIQNCTQSAKFELL